MPGRHRQNIFTKAVFPLDFGRTGSIAMQGSGYRVRVPALTGASPFAGLGAVQTPR